MGGKGRGWVKKGLKIGLILACSILLLSSLALADPMPKKVGLCLPEAGTDKGWNEQARVGLEKVAKKYNIEIVLGEGLGYADIKPTLRDMAKKGCELIILHASGYATSGSEIEKETGVKIVLAESPDKMIIPGRVGGIRTHAGPGGYLAGYLAGKVTKSNIVGVVTSAESGTACRVIAGFVQGLKASNPNCKFLYSLIGEAAYADAAGAKRNADDQIAAGADVIFGHGDGASFGMLQACSSGKKAWFIDLIGDKRDIDEADILLSSVYMDFSIVYDEILQSIANGDFGKVYYVEVENGGIYLLDINKKVPQKIVAELGNVEDEIKSGKIKVVDKPKSEELHAYIKEMFPKK